jgi:hypothetical protein
VDWLTWLSDTALALAMRQSLWLYPIAESLHILGLAVMVGAAAMFDLRLLGVSRHLPVTAMARHLLPWSRRGFGMVVVTGTLMFVSDAPVFAANPAFQAKLGLILVAGTNIAVFHAFTARSVASWNERAKPPVAAKLAGALSLLLWTAVIVAGRFVAYI